MSVLGDLLHSVKLIGAHFHTVDLQGNGAYRVHSPNRLSLHLVLGGNEPAAMSIGRFDLQLRAGQYAFAGASVNHRVGVGDGSDFHELTVPAHRDGDRIATSRCGTGPLRARVMIALLEVDRLKMDAVSGVLPEIQENLQRQGPAVFTVPPFLSLDGLHQAGLVTGGAILLESVGELLLINAVREHITTGKAGAQVFHKAGGAQIAKALHLMYRHPEKAWTIAGLATEAGMSRSAFASAFARNIKTTPIGFLTRVRMMRAESLMQDSRHSLAQVAVLTGYMSETAFNRAFRRYSGLSPGAWRRAHAKD